MGSGKKNKARRKMGAALQAAGMLVMVAGLFYGIAINPISAPASANASAVILIAGLTIGLFLIGFVIVIAGAWMARAADARFGTV